MRQWDSTLGLGAKHYVRLCVDKCMLHLLVKLNLLRSTGEPLSNCCEVLKQIRLVSPSHHVHFFRDYHSKSVVTNFSIWYLFSLPIIQSDLLFQM